jgi:hypothetical protein
MKNFADLVINAAEANGDALIPRIRQDKGAFQFLHDLAVRYLEVRARTAITPENTLSLLETGGIDALSTRFEAIADGRSGEGIDDVLIDIFRQGDGGEISLASITGFLGIPLEDGNTLGQNLQSAADSVFEQHRQEIIELYKTSLPAPGPAN